MMDESRDQILSDFQVKIDYYNYLYHQSFLGLYRFRKSRRLYSYSQ